MREKGRKRERARERERECLPNNISIPHFQFILVDTDDLIWSRELGAVHHAHWMSKIIFQLKIFLVGNRIPLSAPDPNAIKILVEFVVYVCVFFLQKWSDREKRVISSPKHRVALTCIKKLDQYTWYLSPRHVVFALWCDKVADDVKIEMAQSLCEQLRESLMFQVEEGEKKDNNNNIAEKFSLGKPDLPRIYHDSTLAITYRHGELP